VRQWTTAANFLQNVWGKTAEKFTEANKEACLPRAVQYRVTPCRGEWTNAGSIIICGRLSMISGSSRCFGS
jgi:hypothetical protein